MKTELKISRRNVAPAENWWTGSRGDLACPRSGRLNRGRFGPREVFRRLTLRPAPGFSPREKHHLKSPLELNRILGGALAKSRCGPAALKLRS